MLFISHCCYYYLFIYHIIIIITIFIIIIIKRLRLAPGDSGRRVVVNRTNNAREGMFKKNPNNKLNAYYINIYIYIYIYIYICTYISYHISYIRSCIIAYTISCIIHIMCKYVYIPIYLHIYIYIHTHTYVYIMCIYIYIDHIISYYLIICIYVTLLRRLETAAAVSASKLWKITLVFSHCFRPPPLIAFYSISLIRELLIRCVYCSH